MPSREVRSILLALLLMLLAESPARAQQPAVAPPISAAQARQVLDVLNDPGKRAAFTETLTAIARSLPAASPATAHSSATPPANAGSAPPAKLVLAPNSVGSELIGEAGVARKLAAAQAASFGRMFSDMILATHWLRQEIRDPKDRATLADAAWRGTLVILVGLLAEQLLLRLLRRPLRGLARDSALAEETFAEPVPPALAAPLPAQGRPGDGAPGDGAPGDGAPGDGTPEDGVPEARSKDARHLRRTLRLLRRVPFALLRLMLKLLPLALFLVIGNVVASSFADHPVTQLITVTVTNLYGIGRVLALAMDMVLAPQAPGVRLLGITDQAALQLSRWWAWLVAVPVAALAVTDVGGILDLPQAAAQSMIRTIVLIEHILLAGLIWRVRERVGAALTPPRRWRSSAAGAVLSRMAAKWWIVALFFNFAVWLVWAAQVQDGYTRMWRLFLVTVAVAAGCRIAAAALLGLLDRLFRLNPDLERRYPWLERRANRYYPLLRRTLSLAVLAVGLVLLLQAWGLPSLAWFTGGALGTRVVSAIVSILIAMALGVVAWEAANAALDSQIQNFGRASQTARAARLQTLLPILRTVLFIVLAIIVGLSVLSQIGVNVAPLLAGAGILGVAIGFGSQKLVQDFITGIFLLVENAMQVGDTVTAAGVTGTVEHLSIRTLRLRGGDGSVQIIPFSSVTTVINLSRDFAVAAISISVALSEDTDRVCALLCGIGQTLRTDDAFADFILDDFDLNGVDGIGEYAIAISGSMKCTVAGRWPVQREFYRRLNIASQEQHVLFPARPLQLPHPPGPTQMSARDLGSRA